MIPNSLKRKVRRLIRHHFIAPILLDSKISPYCQVSQMVLARQYAESPSSFDLGDVGFSVFSEFEEDGILLYLFAALGPGNRRLVEI